MAAPPQCSIWYALSCLSITKTRSLPASASPMPPLRSKTWTCTRCLSVHKTGGCPKTVWTPDAWLVAALSASLLKKSLGPNRSSSPFISSRAVYITSTPFIGFSSISSKAVSHTPTGKWGYRLRSITDFIGFTTVVGWVCWVWVLSFLQRCRFC